MEIVLSAVALVVISIWAYITFFGGKSREEQIADEMADPVERAKWERARAAQQKIHAEKSLSMYRDGSISSQVIGSDLPRLSPEQVEADTQHRLEQQKWNQEVAQSGKTPWALREERAREERRRAKDGQAVPQIAPTQSEVSPSAPADTEVASAGPASFVPPPAVDTNPGHREQKRRWELVRNRFRAAQIRMATYETDPALAIDYPAFNDVTVPEVKAMVSALRQATYLEDASEKGSPIGGSKELLIELEQAVLAFTSNIDDAEVAARRLRWSHLPAADQDDLERIRQLLTAAENRGNTDTARHTYYAKLQRVVRKLNDRHGVPVIPEMAAAQIEAKARQELER